MSQRVLGTCNGQDSVLRKKRNMGKGDMTRHDAEHDGSVTVEQALEASEA